MPGRNIIKIFEPNSFYHVYNRGIDRSAIFLDEVDYEYWEWLMDSKDSKNGPRKK